MGSSEGETHGATQHASRDAKHGSQKPTSTDAPRKPQNKKTTEKAETEAKEDAKSTSRVQTSSEATTEPSRHEESRSKTHAHEDMTEAKKLYSIQPAMREQFATGFQGSGLWLSCAAIVFLALLL